MKPAAVTRGAGRDGAPRVVPEEVLAHREEGDVWVTVFGRVLDVSDLARPRGSLVARTLFAFAGKDVSHCFDPETQDVATFVHPVTGESTPVAAMVARSPTPAQPPQPLLPWWRDPSRMRGRITERSRPIRIVDSFTSQEVLLWVCSEDTLARVLERYRVFNSDVDRYDCVRAGAADCEDGEGQPGGRPLDRAKTLQENGVEDERDLFALLGLPEDFYVPAVLLIRRQDEVWTAW